MDYNARFISIAFGGRIPLVSAPHFIRIASVAEKPSLMRRTLLTLRVARYSHRVRWPHNPRWRAALYAATERDANKARCTNADYAAIERDTNKARRANEDNAATERYSNKVRRVNADYAVIERDANKSSLLERFSIIRAFS
jgi:restriction endonuclease Mrr